MNFCRLFRVPFVGQFYFSHDSTSDNRYGPAVWQERGERFFRWNGFDIIFTPRGWTLPDSQSD
jgi:hypothetical protein